MFFLINCIISLVIGFVFGFIGGVTGVKPGIAGLPSNIYTLAVFLPALAVAVRRMHDTGRSGWWVIVPIVNLVLLCFDSQPQDNEYGACPKPELVFLKRYESA